LESFTADEAAGEQLFNTPRGPGNLSCNSCHTAPMFITSNAPPFGLADANDAGINGQNRFKSSTLRNITQTLPLFHNGSVPTLEAMLASNIPAHGVPQQDRARIIAFLRTLTDNTINTETRFSDPFVR
jgi:cytochrome c peroxidase